MGNSPKTEIDGNSSKVRKNVKPYDPLSPNDSLPKSAQEIISEYLLSILGGVIYAAAVNLFVFPIGIYIGNMTGIAQIIQDLLRLVFPNLKDVVGIALISLNLPLLIMSFTTINRRFFVKTLLTVAALSATLQIVPVRQVLVGIDDPLTHVLIGGILAGVGAGLCLRGGGSGGGVDILGVYASIKKKGFSVGKVNILIAMLVYIYAFFKFPLPIMVYSILFTLIFGFVVDRVHLQNIKIHVLIRTNNRKVLDIIKTELHRGATYWNAFGAYADEPTYFISTVIAKSEAEKLRHLITEEDPKAFVVEASDVDVTGNFVAHFF